MELPKTVPAQHHCGVQEVDLYLNQFILPPVHSTNIGIYSLIVKFVEIPNGADGIKRFYAIHFGISAVFLILAEVFFYRTRWIAGR
jgi:hypothetical protein